MQISAPISDVRVINTVVAGVGTNKQGRLLATYLGDSVLWSYKVLHPNTTDDDE